MKNYFFKINKKYIEQFFINVREVFDEYDIHTESSFLKSVLRNLNELFKYLGGQISSKDNIPKATDFPESKRFNSLITDINNDFQKLFNAQKFVQSDVTNLLNFNSSQRTKTEENVTSLQQDVYSLFIKSKKGIGKEILVPSSNPFTSSDNMSIESNNVSIDQNRGILTLFATTKITKPLDLNKTNIYFFNAIPEKTIYPNNISMGVGSHWDIPGRASIHFIGNNLTDIEDYKELMIDTPDENTGIGWSEFEAVRTVVDNNSLNNIKNFIATKFKMSESNIYFDIPNSLQGNHISFFHPTEDFSKNRYKLIVYFTQDIGLTNEIYIDFEPNDNASYPQIDFKLSKVFSNQNGTEQFNTLLEPSTEHEVTNNGEYKCVINNGFIVPTRLELVLEYSGDNTQWVKIPFKVSRYSYSAQKGYTLKDTTTPSNDISITLRKTYDVFVDSEVDQQKEQSRAIKVLMNKE
jgi:hypothetical protein